MRIAFAFHFSLLHSGIPSLIINPMDVYLFVVVLIDDFIYFDLFDICDRWMHSNYPRLSIV